MTPICFMLLVLDEIEENESWVWMLILFFLIYFTISLRLLVIPGLFLSFFESFAQKGIKVNLIFIQILLYGFIIWNIHKAVFQNYLATPNLGKQLKSADDIKEANISLWGNFYKEIDNLTQYMKTFYPNIYNYEQNIFKGKFNSNMEYIIFNQHLRNFDVSHGYLVHELTWNYINHYQMLLRRKLFSYSKLCPRIYISNNER